MFDSFKKAILSKRIKKAATPAANIATEGMVIYQRTLQSMLTLMQDFVREVTPVIERNSDKIADAILTLQPVFEELKELQIVKTFQNSKELGERIEDEITQQAVENIKAYAEEFSEAVKAV